MGLRFFLLFNLKKHLEGDRGRVKLWLNVVQSVAKWLKEKGQSFLIYQKEANIFSKELLWLRDI